MTGIDNFDSKYLENHYSQRFLLRTFFYVKKRRIKMYIFLLSSFIQVRTKSYYSSNQLKNMQVAPSTSRSHIDIKIKFLMSKNSQTPIFIQILTLLQKLFGKNRNKNETSTPCISETKHFRTYIYTNFFTYFYLQNMLPKFPEYSSDHPVYVVYV